MPRLFFILLAQAIPSTSKSTEEAKTLCDALPEYAGPIKGVCNHIVTNNPEIVWIVSGLIFLTIIVAAVAKLTGDLDKIIGFVRKYVGPTQRETPEAQQPRLRLQLIVILQTSVAKRLRFSLHQLVKIDLEREEQRQRVGQSSLPLVAEDPAPEPSLERPLNRELDPFRSDQPPEPIDPAQPTLVLCQG